MNQLVNVSSFSLINRMSSCVFFWIIHLELSLLLENVLFLGDLALFFPDVFHRFYDKDQQRRTLTSWCYSFAAETDFYDEKSLEILSLVIFEKRKLNFDLNFSSLDGSGIESHRKIVDISQSICLQSWSTGASAFLVRSILFIVRSRSIEKTHRNRRKIKEKTERKN